MLLPPIVVSGLRHLRALRGGQEWEFAGEEWQTPSGLGWADESVADTQRARWPGFMERVASPGVLGSSPEVGAVHSERAYANHNTAMTFAYVIALASCRGKRISMLDWGGGIGQYGVLARSLVPGVEIDYHCRDLDPLVSVGREVLPDATFHDSDASAFTRKYDLVMASSSLQYVKEWQALIRALARVTRGYLYVTRTPFVQRASSFVVIQRPLRHGYATQYQGWVLNRDEFLGAANEAGLLLLREFLIDERPRIERAPEQPAYRGYLFAPSQQAP